MGMDNQTLLCLTTLCLDHKCVSLLRRPKPVHLAIVTHIYQLWSWYCFTKYVKIDLPNCEGKFLSELINLTDLCVCLCTIQPGPGDLKI